jgi:hypothetical protein
MGEFMETSPARTKIETQINICNPLNMEDIKDEQERCSADTVRVDCTMTDNMLLLIHFAVCL